MGTEQSCCPKPEEVTDGENGERFCPNCGTVFDGENLDSNLYRAFTLDEMLTRKQNEVVGTLSNNASGTMISKSLKDASGKKLPAGAYAQAQILRTWNNRVKLDSGEDRNLLTALNFLKRLSEKLELPYNVMEEAALVYRTALKYELIKGRTIEGIVSASVYGICRSKNIPRSLKEVSDAANIKVSELSRNFRLLLTTEGIGGKILDLYAPDPKRNVNKIISYLRLPEMVEKKSIEVIEAYDEGREGKSPLTIAAAAVYLAAIRSGFEYIRQKDISGIVGVTDVSLRNRSGEMKRDENVKRIFSKWELQTPNYS